MDPNEYGVTFSKRAVRRILVQMTGIVSLTIIVLRRTRPDLPRPFRMPLAPVLPVLSALVSFLLMLSLPWSTWERLILWMTIGVGVYFAYGFRHSRLNGGSAGS